MNQFSVVIIARNEAHIIGDTIRAVQTVTDDVVVADNGSTDGTQDIVTALHARLLPVEWEGYGITKNKGIAAARYDWILNIDADEIPDQKMLEALNQLSFGSNDTVYVANFKTFLGNKLIRFGEWGGDAHIRLFNRQRVMWNNAEVHEQLMLPDGVVKKTLGGHILHYTMKDIADYSQKMTKYALLNAERYHQQRRQSSFAKRRLSPRFSFFQNYILKLGFLDGHAGYIIARMTAYYTFLKYERLYELNKKAKQ